MLHHRTIVTGLLTDFAVDDRAPATMRHELINACHDAGTATLDRVDHSINRLMKLDDATGGEFSYPLACAQLSSVADLLKSGPHPAAVEERLWRSAAELSRLAAWGLTDMGNNALAERYSIAGLKAAKEGKSPEVGANVIRTFSEQQTLSGNYSNALALLRIAEIGAWEKLTNAEKAGLRKTALRAQARVGNKDSAAEVQDSMLEYFAKAEGEQKPPRAYWVHGGELAAWSGETNYRLGNLETAQKELTHAIANAEEFKNRECGSWLIYLSRVYLAQQDVEQAVEAASAALDRLSLVRSPRSERDFADLRMQLNPYQNHVYVRELDEKAQARLGQRLASV